MKKAIRNFVICASAALAFMPGFAVAQQGNGLGRVQPGLYRIKPTDFESRATEQPQNICIGNVDMLFRLYHRDNTGCHDRFVQPGQERVIVTYSCAVQGWGRTEVRREAPGIYQLDTQGIKAGQPFALRAEARRLGDCVISRHAASRR